MSDSEGFQARLEAAVQAKRQHIEENSLPQLRERFRIFQSLFENLYNILLRKALVQEDPYKYEQKISEVVIPPKGDILDSERTEKLSQRLSSFHAQLEFLNTYYQFSLEFINLQRVRRLIMLARYISWDHVSESTPDATTSALAATLNKVHPSGDNVSRGIISTSLTQLQSISRAILVQLKEILAFQRQSYKLMLRQKLFPRIGANLGRLYAGKPAKAYDRMRSVFAQTVKGRPFYRDLVSELLEEEFGEKAGELQERSLSQLQVSEEKAADLREKPDYKAILLEAVRLMLPACVHLRDALRKVVGNQDALEKSRRGFGGKLRSWLLKTFQSREQSLQMEIRYFDSRTSATLSETIDFHKFSEGVRRKTSLFEALHQPDSTAFSRLSESSEEQIDSLLKKNVGELQLMYRRLQGLNESLLQEAPQELKEQLKGIKIELSGLKNCIVRSNRRRYEYVALKEEEVRLQQLGVAETPQ